MPILKQFPPSPKAKKPGNKFFASVILLGVAILILLWLKEKRPSPIEKTKSRQQLALKKTNAASVQVLVMNKTNLPASKATDVISFPPTKIQKIAVPITPAETNISASSAFMSRPVQNVLEAQIALARLGISAGSIDGAIGSQTRAALRAFQQNERLPITGELDSATKAKLILSAPLYTEFVVTTNELARLQTVGTNWWSKSQQTRLDYETILELAAEKSWSHPGFIKQLNPSVNWTNVIQNTKLKIPNVEMSKAKARAAFVRIRLADKNLEAFDENTNLLAHFPCSIAKHVEKRPVGELRVEKIAPNPDYTFAPENFPESAEARLLKTKLIIPPGPNNPVGTVWIGLDKPGYGIHGTPKPEEVGRTESHGCFRLANWNAEYLLRLVTIGTPVFVEP